MIEEEKFLEKFKEIAEKRWIKGVNNFTNSVGLTFENLLGKKPDSLFFPDYRGFEIKCTQRYSNFPMRLFTSAFDGPDFYEVNKLLQKYGKDDEEYIGRKRLISSLKVDQKILVNDKYYFELKVDAIEKLLYINIYDEQFKLLERGPYILFSTLENRLTIKLSKLVLVYASKKEYYNNKYFRYYKIIFYKLKSFERFITLIIEGDVNVNIVCRASRSGDQESRQRNQNIVFQIPKDKIFLLFDEYISYDADKI